MIFHETSLKGAYVIEPERIEDSRGFFARIWCKREFRDRGLDSSLKQCGISFNRKRGTLRGMHYQATPYEETKLIRCTAGAIHDVIIDLRPDSETFKKWVAVDLSGENRKMLYVPGGFAHGFIALADATEVFYQMSQFYMPDHARGVRWDDPAFSIEWPIPVTEIAERDRSYPDFLS